MGFRNEFDYTNIHSYAASQWVKQSLGWNLESSTQPIHLWGIAQSFEDVPLLEYSYQTVFWEL